MGLLDWLLLGVAAKTARSASRLERNMRRERKRASVPLKVEVSLPAAEDEPGDDVASFIYCDDADPDRPPRFYDAKGRLVDRDGVPLE